MVDTLSNYAQAEREVLAEMDRTRDNVETSLSSIVDEIRKIDKEKRTGVGILNDIDESMIEMQLDRAGPRFVPWQARTVDRLVMKLDSLARKQDDDRGDLVEGSDDE